MTVVSQLITAARTRFGATKVEAIAVDGSLLDEAMDHVLAVGGDVSLETCIVDGVEVRELPEGETTPLAYVEGTDEPQPVTTGE